MSKTLTAVKLCDRSGPHPHHAVFVGWESWYWCPGIPLTQEETNE